MNSARLLSFEIGFSNFKKKSGDLYFLFRVYWIMK